MESCIARPDPQALLAGVQQSEVLSIQNLVKAAKVYALAALNLCGSGSDA